MPSRESVGGKRRPVDSHHPGEPRFVEVGEEIVNPAHVGEYDIFGVRDNIAPRVPDPQVDPENYAAEAFEWSLVDRPAGSEAELQFAQSGADERSRWDAGTRHTADFVADVPREYVFELDAPDGTHEWRLFAFPAGEGAPPRLSLDGYFEAGTFHIDAEATLAPGRTDRATRAPERDDDTTITAVYLADDRDSLETAAVEQDGLDAHVPLDALDGESARIHAAVWDGHRRSMMDTLELHPDGSLTCPNRPPEWAREGVLYQIFPRSWAGERGEATLDDLIDGVDYLDELGIDVVWLTPVVPDEATARQFDQPLLPDAYRQETLSGGGPHGYGTLEYLGIAPDLVPEGTDPVDAYQAFVEACHDQGIKVVFDLVISHTGRSHPFFQDTIASQGTAPADGLRYPIVLEWDHASKYFDWYDRIERVGTKRGAPIEVAPHPTGFFGGRSLPNLNYNNVAVREHALAVAEFWSGVVGVDGFRCDIAWGVPLSFWRELRELVRANDSEFLLLDETVPNDPRMAENAFDMHFDTKGFTEATQAVADGEAEAETLLEVIEKRASDGFPDHSLVLNMTENHDEHRLLNRAVVDPTDPNHDERTPTQWAAGARTQRLCWAAGVLLPGVPGVYYGQERQISRYGEGRHRGSTDPRGQGETVDSFADVRPGGRQRAFMNWEEYDPEHLAFYRRLIDCYHRLDVLKPDAALHEIQISAADEVLVFERDASHLDGIEGPEQVLVVLNFGDQPATVAIDHDIGETDLVTGTTVETGSEKEQTTLEVEDLVVLETETFESGTTAPSGTGPATRTRQY